VTPPPLALSKRRRKSRAMAGRRAPTNLVIALSIAIPVSIIVGALLTFGLLTLLD